MLCSSTSLHFPHALTLPCIHGRDRARHALEPHAIATESALAFQQNPWPPSLRTRTLQRAPGCRGEGIMILRCATNPVEHFPHQQQLQSWKKKDLHKSGRGGAVNTKAMIGERVMKREKVIEADDSQHLDSLQPYEIKSYMDPETFDRDKDDRIISRRTVYDHSDWLRHRSSTRHVRHIVCIASSRVVRALGPPVMSLTFLSFLVTLFNEAVLTGGLPPWMPLLRMSSLPFQLTAPVLALLLVFRTNASYARFDEARKLWGVILNRMRDVTRQLLTWLPNSDIRAEALRHLVALPLCLKDHLTREETLREELSEVLEEKEVDAVMAAKHRPLFILQTLSHIIQSSPLTDIQRAIMEQSLSSFMDAMGSCERIYKTPIPLSYTRLTSRFLVIWHAALPFALWDQCNWTAVPATLLSAAALFCIEEVGVHIEEPFSILPLDSICQVARTGAHDLEAAHTGIAARRHELHDSLRSISDSSRCPSPSLSPTPPPAPNPPGPPIPPKQTGQSSDIATRYSSSTWVFPASDPDPLPSLALEETYRFGEWVYGEEEEGEEREGRGAVLGPYSEIMPGRSPLPRLPYNALPSHAGGFTTTTTWTRSLSPSSSNTANSDVLCRSQNTEVGA